MTHSPADPIEKRTSAGGFLLSCSTYTLHAPTATKGEAKIAARFKRRARMMLLCFTDMMLTAMTSKATADLWQRNKERQQSQSSTGHDSTASAGRPGREGSPSMKHLNMRIPCTRCTVPLESAALQHGAGSTQRHGRTYQRATEQQQAPVFCRNEEGTPRLSGMKFIPHPPPTPPCMSRSDICV